MLRKQGRILQDERGMLPDLLLERFPPNPHSTMRHWLQRIVKRLGTLYPKNRIDEVARAKQKCKKEKDKT